MHYDYGVTEALGLDVIKDLSATVV